MTWSGTELPSGQAVHAIFLHATTLSSQAQAWIHPGAQVSSTLQMAK